MYNVKQNMKRTVTPLLRQPASLQTGLNAFRSEETGWTRDGASSSLERAFEMTARVRLAYGVIGSRHEGRSDVLLRKESLPSICRISSSEKSWYQSALQEYTINTPAVLVANTCNTCCIGKCKSTSYCLVIVCRVTCSTPNCWTLKAVSSISLVMLGMAQSGEIMTRPYCIHRWWLVLYAGDVACMQH